MRPFLLLCLALLLANTGFSTHIVGGSLTYEHLGGATFRVTLKMYRDCRPGNAAFPGSVNIEVRDINGNLFSPSKNISMPFTTSVPVNPYIDTCAANPGLCLEEAIYTRVVNNLPPVAGGYHMYYQYCCRNSTLSNIVNPLNAGESWYSHVPDMSTLITNSSPAWVNPPPVFVCQAEQINFDFSATDADGDSLVYSWYTPYSDPTPTFPSGNATFTPVTWQPGYGPNNPCGGPNLIINPQTGYITGSPPNIGQFVAGVRCEEYRNGVKIGEILRDFQFNVVYCPPLAQAGIGQPTGICSGSTVNFLNTSDPANSYFWNFGDAAATTDTSSQISPSYTYPGLGPYTVELIINVGTACADTTYQTVELSYVNVAYAPSNDSACVGQPLAFADSSSPSPNSTITGYWWDFGDGNQSAAQNPTHTYLASGTYTVYHTATNQLGCDDTISQNVFVIAGPIALAGNDTFACTNNSNIGLGGNVLNSSSGMWSGPGTFTPNANVLNATYTPTQAELDSGYTYLVLQTTGISLCAQDADTLLITFSPGPTADAGPDQVVCRDTTYVSVCGSVSVASGGVWSTSGTGSFLNPNNLCTDYYPGAADASAGSVMLLFTTTGNGSCFAETDTVVIYLTPPPNVSASSVDTACSNLPFALTAVTATGAGFWTTLGDGIFPNGDSNLVSSYLPGAGDLATGSVTIVFNSLNNGGCRQQHDTLVVAIIPAPGAAFSYTSMCPFINVPFTDLSTSSGPIVGWSWNFGDPASSANTSSQTNPSHPYPAGGWYNVTLTVISANGCPDTVVQSVYIYPQPVPAFSTAGFCLNDGTTFNDISTVDTGSVTGWSWDFGDATAAIGNGPWHIFPNAGSWNVTLIATSNFGCSDTITQPVLIYPSPTAAFNTAPATAANTQQTVSFFDQSFANILSWTWDFGDSTGSAIQNPTHAWQNPGTYPVILVVADTNGCTDTLITDYIISSPPVVPSGFSPNNDNQNDVFVVRGGPFKELELRIYNEWGEVIFIGTSQADGWDGTRDGVPQRMGVYIYTVHAVTYDDKVHDLNGDVTLLR
jgi:gliding motility-associated-like protein